MAVIQKIRSYSGLLIAVIGIGLAAFVLGDFLGHGPMQQQRFDVGKVEGTSIPYQQFDQRVNQQMDNWQQQTGESPGSQQAFQIRQQVWNDMVREILLEEELENLGIAVKAEELYEMIHGSDPHPILIQSFSDPATGTYDPQQVVEFLRNFDRMDPQVRSQWVMLEEHIKSDRREDKYNQLISKSYGVPDALAAADFSHRNTTADIRFAYKTTDEIDDDQVSVSDRELRAVYDNHKHRFRQEASRGLKMVVQPVHPSETDQENAMNEILELREEMQDVENIPAFINAVSDRRFDPTYYAEGELSPQIDPEIFDAQEGDIFGPYMEDNAYVVSMLVDAQMRPDSMRASHILISYQGSQSATEQTMLAYDDAQQMADSLLGVVRANPNRFPELAMEMSDDPSAAANQGDLEWFRDGEMVQNFNEAVVEGTVGSFLTVETDFGFHVVQVTDKSPLTQKVQVANLIRNIEPGNRTYQDAYSAVSRFASEVREGADFEEAAAEAGLNVREAPRVGPMDVNLPGIDEGRQVVQWAFGEDTSVGDFSRIFELDNTFVVATLAEKRDEGIPSLSQIRSQIMSIARDEKKKEMIAEEITQAMANGSLDNVAGQLGLEVAEANDLTFASNNLPGMGPEPKVIGSAFAMSEGTAKGPVIGNSGVFIVEVVRMDEEVVPSNLTANKRRLQDAFLNRVPMDAFEAIKNRADIEDNRAMFF